MPTIIFPKKGVLACRRITGIHSAYVLALNIDEVIKSFNIPIRKILKIITDGGSNFKKAFKDHQLGDVTAEEEDDDDGLTEILNDTTYFFRLTIVVDHTHCV